MPAKFVPRGGKFLEKRYKNNLSMPRVTDQIQNTILSPQINVVITLAKNK